MPLGEVTAKITGAPSSDVYKLVEQYNNLANAVRAIGVVLDADAGVSATTFVSGIIDAQVSIIKDQNGTEL